MKAYGYAGFVCQHFPVEIAALKPHAALTVRYTILRLACTVINALIVGTSVSPVVGDARDEFVDVVSTFRYVEFLVSYFQTFVGAVKALHVLPQESPTSLKKPLGIVYSKKIIKARMVTPKKTFALLDNSLEIILLEQNRRENQSLDENPIRKVTDQVQEAAHISGKENSNRKESQIESKNGAGQNGVRKDINTKHLKDIHSYCMIDN
ncbi:aminoglycoside 2'-N-acetyltransferase [Striga asiatica]|uniref:Aminoglycoside 2'-N-acetyltransferase n=1 Tax=Striga asiatica TaxID=4170 RepID=A0A5A7PWD9_STRAF|nr:aminoglycoside 2'-N-acetyltransferase [Striga asiatica]